MGRLGLSHFFRGALRNVLNSNDPIRRSSGSGFTERDILLWTRFSCSLVLAGQPGAAYDRDRRAALPAVGYRFYPLSWLLDSSIRYFGIFDANLVRNWLCLLTGPTLNAATVTSG